MIILDTHTLLWFLTDSDKLSEDLKKIYFPRKKRFYQHSFIMGNCN